MASSKCAVFLPLISARPFPSLCLTTTPSLFCSPHFVDISLFSALSSFALNPCPPPPLPFIYGLPVSLAISPVFLAVSSFSLLSPRFLCYLLVLLTCYSTSFISPWRRVRADGQRGVALRHGSGGCGMVVRCVGGGAGGTGVAESAAGAGVAAAAAAEFGGVVYGGAWVDGVPSPGERS